MESHKVLLLIYTACVLLPSCTCSAQTLSWANVNGMRCVLKQMMLEDIADDREFNLVGGCIRLMFHDGVGGGLDGCIQLTNPSNGGLEVHMTRLKAAREKHGWEISMADLYVLCANTALEIVANNTGDPDVIAVVKHGLNLKLGRHDRPPPCPRRGFPDFNPHPINYMRKSKRFPKLTMNEAVALMGIHTIGRARSSTSGYEGHWNTDHTTLINSYFHHIDTEKSKLVWTLSIAKHNGAPKAQWNSEVGGTKIIALHQDMALCVKLTLRGGGKPRCRLRGSSGNTDQFGHLEECQEADTLPIVRAFAADQLAFVGNLSNGFNVLADTGQNTLYVPTGLLSDGECDI